jgi:hypothetical protein
MTISDDTPEEKSDPTWEELRDNPVLFMSDYRLGDCDISEYHRKALAQLMNIYGIKISLLGDAAENASAATFRLQERLTQMNARLKRDKKE